MNSVCSGMVSDSVPFYTINTMSSQKRISSNSATQLQIYSIGPAQITDAACMDFTEIWDKSKQMCTSGLSLEYRWFYGHPGRDILALFSSPAFYLPFYAGNCLDREYFIRTTLCTWHCRAAMATGTQAIMIIIVIVTVMIVTVIIVSMTTWWCSGLMPMDAALAAETNSPKPSQQGEKAEPSLIQHVPYC